jgi:hypothetical protein
LLIVRPTLCTERKNMNLLNNKTLRVRRIYDPAGPPHTAFPF